MSFLRNYLKYASGNEAPEMFHVWAGYTAISAAVARKVWLPFEDIAIYPNIYVMLVGDAGNGKSWAMQKCKRLLAKLPGVCISGSLETPQGLMRFMAGNEKADPPVESPVKMLVKWPDGQLRETHPMTLVANEFVNFISLDDKGWINMLNDIYDEDVYHYRTKNQGEDNLIGPYIVMLGALTTDVSHDLQKARIISTGLARRTFFQYGERRWFDPVPKPAFTAEQDNAREVALKHLLKLRSTAGAFKWPDDVDKWWTAWYREHLAGVPRRAPQVKSWYASKSTQLLKLAMLTSLSERDDLVLCVADFKVALAYLETLERDLPRIFGGTGRNELAGIAQKVLDYVEGQLTPIAYKALKSTFFHACKPPNDFEECLNFLLSSDKLQRATLTVGQRVDDIIATPEVMKKFVAEHAQRHGGVPPASQTGSPPASGQQAAPPAPPATSPPVLPNDAEPPPGTAT